MIQATSMITAEIVVEKALSVQVSGFRRAVERIESAVASNDETGVYVSVVEALGWLSIVAKRASLFTDPDVCALLYARHRGTHQSASVVCQARRRLALAAGGFPSDVAGPSASASEAAQEVRAAARASAAARCVPARRRAPAPLAGRGGVVLVEQLAQPLVRAGEPPRVCVLELSDARPHDRREVPEVDAALDRPRRQRVPADLMQVWSCAE
jgi:hypothetical protein